MKRLLSIGMAAAMLCSAAVFMPDTQIAASAAERAVGDLNGDGTVNLKDVVILRRYIAGDWDVSLDDQTADLNENGKVNMKDVALLRRYIAGGWDVAADINAADLNGDGNVNLKDVTILRRYIAGGWNVEINSNNP